MTEWTSDLQTFRFSEGFAGPHESITVQLNRRNDVRGHYGVQDRPHVSTTVVSTALATGLFVQRSAFCSQDGESNQACLRG